nr:MAG TPA: Envelope protein [Caudoviricetes sp.]DAY39222.1 MAG TPA: Envelope protein [Caudoviricetes sp.]
MLKFKEFLQLFCIVVIELPLELVSWLIVPIALLFCNKQSERLPKWARYFEDASDYYNGENSAINGDSGWRKEHYPNGKNRTYFARLKWLYRNRIGYFSSRINGVKVSEIEPSSLITKGNPRVTSNGGVISDFCKVTCKLKSGRTRFGLFKTIRYKGFLSGFYCRIYIGWKLLDVAEMNEYNKDTFMQPDDKEYLKSVWAINPFKRVRGSNNAKS